MLFFHLFVNFFSLCCLSAIPFLFLSVSFNFLSFLLLYAAFKTQDSAIVPPHYSFSPLFFYFLLIFCPISLAEFSLLIFLSLPHLIAHFSSIFVVESISCLGRLNCSSIFY
ncbi:hypothetical protein ES288_D10G166800v1 [Gossypium darwinii]|uniref:Uncharacterized protein n=1 Tax=Gossypium darwinii TaxID=34276 RepID=A0A5D2B3Z8_GOSDA|nr:hypothetical protein ES288_D10G166800v1 [Gossypium darwinii]